MGTLQAWRARAERWSWRRVSRTFAVTSVVLLLQECDPQCTPPPPSQGPEGIVYLTFDDGPSGYTHAMLDVLGRHGATATFFVIGSNIGGREGTVAAAAANGHAIGNHTWSHPDLRQLSTSAIRSQVASTNDAIASAIGRGSGCLRPPYGYSSDRVESVVAEFGMFTVGWTIDTVDWSDSASVSSITRHLNNARDGSVILMHDGGGNQSDTVQAVDQWLSDNAGRFGFHPLPGC